MKIEKAKVVNILDQVSEAFHATASWLAEVWLGVVAIGEGLQKLALGLLVAALYLGILSIPIWIAALIFQAVLKS